MNLSLLNPILLTIILTTEILSSELKQFQYDKYKATPIRNETSKTLTLPLVPCEELIQTVERNLYKKGSVNQIQLIDSSWLQSVDGYEYKDKIIVIATIKRQSDIFGKKYIFCNVPLDNWDYFYSPFRDISKSFGERFHRAIFDYQCDCN